MTYWIENGDEKVMDIPDLATAKREAKRMMKKRQEEGELYPLVHLIASDNSHALHFDNYSGRWHRDEH